MQLRFDLLTWSFTLTLLINIFLIAMILQCCYYQWKQSRLTRYECIFVRTKEPKHIWCISVGAGVQILWCITSYTVDWRETTKSRTRLRLLWWKMCVQDGLEADSKYMLRICGYASCGAFCFKVSSNTKLFNIEMKLKMITRLAVRKYKCTVKIRNKSVRFANKIATLMANVQRNPFVCIAVYSSFSMPWCMKVDQKAFPISA